MTDSKPLSDSRVFISHASKNFRIADDLRARLESMGLACWIAPRDIPAGSSYGEEITKAIASCTALVFVLTQEANASKAIANELEMAFRHQKVIVPIRLQEVEPASSLAFFINNTQWVDACHTPLKQRVQDIARIVEAVQAGTPPPAPRPEQKTLLGRLERQIEGMVRHKFLTLAVIVSLLVGLGIAGTLSSAQVLSRMDTSQDLIDQDPATYGLVNLAALSEGGPGAKTLRLQATAFMNLKDPVRAQVTWKAFAMAPGSPARSVDTSPLTALQAPGVQMLPFELSPGTTAVVFCMTALHPQRKAPHTARWDFTLDATQEAITIGRAGAPRLTLASAQVCP